MAAVGDAEEVGAEWVAVDAEWAVDVEKVEGDGAAVDVDEAAKRAEAHAGCASTSECETQLACRPWQSGLSILRTAMLFPPSSGTATSGTAALTPSSLYRATASTATAHAPLTHLARAWLDGVVTQLFQRVRLQGLDGFAGLGAGYAEVHNFARPLLDDEVLAERPGSMTPLTVVLRARAQRREALCGSRRTPRADEGSGQEGMISVRCSCSGRSAKCPSEMQHCGVPCQCLRMAFIRWLSPTGRNSPTSR